MYLIETSGPPQDLKVLEVRHDFVKLSWKPPSFDGGSPIVSYVLEMRDKLQTK